MTVAEVAAAVADAHRREWGAVLAATIRITRDIDLAEECVQDALIQALNHWDSEGIPDQPGAWLTTVAKRRAFDLLKREVLRQRTIPLLVEPDPHPDEEDLLRLIFTCCHPALSPEAQIALTLRLVLGLSTSDIGRAFLVQESTIAARITRAKAKIAQARIPYRVPPPEELTDRIDAVLTVVYLVFTTGHTSPDGTQLLRVDLIERALDLSRTLRLLLPQDPDVAGLHALLTFSDARRGTRTDADGQLVLLKDQDRTQWDRRAIAEGIALTKRSLRGRSPGRFPLMAAIAAVHSEAHSWDDTDWVEIAGLYEHLIRVWPSPVVALNRAIAIGYADGPQAGLAALDALAEEPLLVGYHYLPSARAELLAQLGRTDDARACYEQALSIASNEVERRFLELRIAALPQF